MAIRMIALDLDGTTLNSRKELTSATKDALEASIDRGVFVVIATGRVQNALPANVLAIEGIQYALTSNGAVIVDLRSKKPIYENYIASAAIVNIAATLRNYNFMVEVFTGGHAYVEKEIYENVEKVGLGASHAVYVRQTREPVEHLLDFMLDHKDSIENVNVNFGNQKDRAMMRSILGALPDVTLTSSFDHNLELGGATTSKAEALLHLAEMLGISASEIMACGDSPNDSAMLMAAGLPVAMENGKDEIKGIAKYITATNDEDGVARAVRKFVLEV